MNYLHAIELIDVSEVKRFSGKKLASLLTPYERDYCQLHKKRQYEHIAARLAAKKAFDKLIPLADWQELEIQKDKNGKPIAHLLGQAKAAFKKKKLKTICLSLSHTQQEAIASLFCF